VNADIFIIRVHSNALWFHILFLSTFNDADNDKFTQSRSQQKSWSQKAAWLGGIWSKCNCVMEKGKTGETWAETRLFLFTCILFANTAVNGLIYRLWTSLPAKKMYEKERVLREKLKEFISSMQVSHKPKSSSSSDSANFFFLCRASANIFQKKKLFCNDANAREELERNETKLYHPIILLT
jgi:hypothetical protein